MPIPVSCTATTTCTAEGAELVREANRFGNVSTAALVIGGALAVAGVITIVTAPSDDSDVSATLSVKPAPRGASGTLSVRF